MYIIKYSGSTMMVSCNFRSIQVILYAKCFVVILAEKGTLPFLCQTTGGAVLADWDSTTFCVLKMWIWKKSWFGNKVKIVNGYTK